MAARSDESELKRLNEETFLAEAKRSIGSRTWREYLENVLDDTFVLRRSRPDREDEDKDAMLAAVERVEQPPKRKLLPGTVRVWASETLGVVASTVTLPVEGQTSAFANVKVFVRSDGRGWRCIYWQVSSRPLP